MAENSIDRARAREEQHGRFRFAVVVLDEADAPERTVEIFDGKDLTETRTRANHRLHQALRGDEGGVYAVAEMDLDGTIGRLFAVGGRSRQHRTLRLDPDAMGAMLAGRS